MLETRACLKNGQTKLTKVCLGGNAGVEPRPFCHLYFPSNHRHGVNFVAQDTVEGVAADMGESTTEIDQKKEVQTD